MKVYLSIPITGRDIEQVKAELAEVAEKIREKGWEPVSPLDGVTDYNLPWIEYIIRDLQILKECDAICRIYTKKVISYGCGIESMAAEKMGLVEVEYSMHLHKFLVSPMLKKNQQAMTAQQFNENERETT